MYGPAGTSVGTAVGGSMVGTSLANSVDAGERTSVGEVSPVCSFNRWEAQFFCQKRYKHCYITQCEEKQQWCSTNSSVRTCPLVRRPFRKTALRVCANDAPMGSVDHPTFVLSLILWVLDCDFSPLTISYSPMYIYIYICGVLTVILFLSFFKIWTPVSSFL